MLQPFAFESEESTLVPPDPDDGDGEDEEGDEETEDLPTLNAINPTPLDPALIDPALIDPTPLDPAPVDFTSIDSTPLDSLLPAFLRTKEIPNQHHSIMKTAKSSISSRHLLCRRLHHFDLGLIALSISSPGSGDQQWSGPQSSKVSGMPSHQPVHTLFLFLPVLLLSTGSRKMVHRLKAKAHDLKLCRGRLKLYRGMYARIALESPLTLWSNWTVITMLHTARRKRVHFHGNAGTTRLGSCARLSSNTYRRSLILCPKMKLSGFGMIISGTTMSG